MTFGNSRKYFVNLSQMSVDTLLCAIRDNNSNEDGGEFGRTRTLSVGLYPIYPSIRSFELFVEWSISVSKSSTACFQSEYRTSISLIFSLELC